MKKSKGFIIFIFLLHGIPFAGMAQSPLASLPFGINVGSTKNTEIGDNGVCVASMKTKDSVSHCIRYSMQNNKFSVYCNPEGTIIKVSFLAVSHHVLPANWTALGLKLATTFRYRKAPKPGTLSNSNNTPLDAEVGNSQQQVLDIITANGAQNISRKTSYTSDYQIGEHISFTIGTHLYNAEFIKWIKPKWCLNCPDYTDYDNGLVSIEIIEIPGT